MYKKLYNKHIMFYYKKRIMFNSASQCWQCRKHFMFDTLKQKVFKYYTLRLFGYFMGSHMKGSDKKW